MLAYGCPVNPLSDVGSQLVDITLAIQSQGATTAKTRYDYLSDFTHIWEAVYADSDAIL